MRIRRLHDGVDVASVGSAGKYTFGFSPTAPTLAIQPKDGEIALWNVDFPMLGTRAPVTGALKVRPPSVMAPPSADPLPHSPLEPQPAVLDPEPAQFDVFMCHNGDDAAAVRAVAELLKKHDIRPWIDREQIPAGRSFQSAVQEAFPRVHAAAVFLGPAGFGPWQTEEIEVILSRGVERSLTVIGVLLPGAPEIPDSQAFLRFRTWVRFQSLDDPKALAELTRGIQQGRPS